METAPGPRAPVAGPGCGKSTIALNLALSPARQAEQRTVLAGLDLRRPSLARLPGLRQPQDLVRVLEGRAPFAAQAARIGANPAFSTCRGPTRQRTVHAGISGQPQATGGQPAGSGGA